MRRTPLARISSLQPGSPPLGTARLNRASELRPREGRRPKTSATRTSATRRPESFPKAVAALIDERDPWCVHCGSPFGLHRHHRRIKGMGGDGRDHTDCACDGVRLCLPCHTWAHSGDGQPEAEAEGLIIPRSTTEPWAWSVLVHLEDDRGGMRKYPTCDGRWADSPDEVAA